MSPRAAGLAFAALSALTACSWALGDFSGYTDPDPNVPGGDGGGADGAGPTDGGGTDDDGTTPVEASTGFCRANADAGVFCEDFDGTGDAIAHFDRRQETGGVLTVDSASSASAPKSLLVNLPAGTSPGETYVVMSAKTSGAHARLEFKARAEESATGTAAAQFAKLWFFSSGGGSYEVGIGFEGDVYVYEFSSGNYKQLANVKAPPASGWHHFVIDVRIDNAPRVDVELDGKRVVDSVALTPPYEVGAMEAAVGLPYVDANHGSWRIRFDDILYSVPQ